MLFKVSSTIPFKELNPQAEAIEELWKLADRQLLAIALTADYQSPLRDLPEKKRRYEAAKIAGYLFEKDGKRPDKNFRDFIDGAIVNVEAGIVRYRELQYDEDQEMLKAINSQITQVMDLMQMDKLELAKEDPKLAFDLAERASKLGIKLPELKNDLIATINSKGNSPIDVVTYTSADISLDDSDEALSTLDKFMATQINKE